LLPEVSAGTLIVSTLPILLVIYGHVPSCTHLHQVAPIEDVLVDVSGFI